MDPVKLTKQGVRDLNHLGPKKPAATAEGAVAVAVLPIPAPALESPTLPPSPPTA
jgi:hypothetical protein